MPTCFFCGREHNHKIPKHFPLDNTYYPCPTCQETMKRALTMLAVKYEITDEQFPEISTNIWPTGEYLVIPNHERDTILTEELFPSGNIPPKNCDFIIVEDSVFQKIKIRYNYIKETEG